MANFVPICRMALLLVMLMVIGAPTYYAQISTPCNASALTTNLFTPCMNFLTNSSGNGTSPTAECCGALKTLTSGGMDCLCLLVTGSLPFTIPFNRSLAISLPRACNMPGVPVQCKAKGSPLPAPGPASLGPSPSPAASAPSPGFAPSPSPQASSVIPSPTLAPQSDTTTPPPLFSPPSASTGSSGRSDITPSSSSVTPYNVPPSVLLIALGVGVALLTYY